MQNMRCVNMNTKTYHKQNTEHNNRISLDKTTVRILIASSEGEEDDHYQHCGLPGRVQYAWSEILIKTLCMQCL